MNKKLIKMKDLNSNDKIFIMYLIENTNPFLPYSITTQEFANEIGLSKKIIHSIIDKLVEMDFISTKVDGSSRSRITNITNRLKTIINEK